MIKMRDRIGSFAGKKSIERVAMGGTVLKDPSPFSEETMRVDPQNPPHSILEWIVGSE